MVARMRSRRRQRQQQKMPDTVVATFYPLGGLINGVEGLEDGELTPTVIARVVAAGDVIKKRLQYSAELLSKLRALGWSGLGDLEWMTLSKESTREKAIQEFASLHVDPREISLQEVYTDDDEGGWVNVGKEFTVPEEAVRNAASIPREDLTRMRTELQLMQRALRRQKHRASKRKPATTKSRPWASREEQLVKNNDILTNAIRIVSTYLEEVLAQPESLRRRE